ncbi:MAG: hypothetical protein IK048_05745 [Clostridia bacterium]|nr:hypothetical protein [Clostridia bacterium]
MIDALMASVEYTSMVTAVLSAILGVVVVVFVVLLGMLLSRNAADKRRLDEDAYKRELASNRELREQKREQKKENAKPRHGKKNKS